eukprot:TRINITY_DN6276_c0_g3_i1.p1 TRINITY_DN6276_c0_g3~~TRINITY_DN6276_c0_g3_i1.p1  ORF type:complete len:343 (-),score=27.74 TRINITY_DN6276_c0_g3_i1:247-1275(-)
MSIRIQTLHQQGFPRKPFTSPASTGPSLVLLKSIPTPYHQVSDVAFVNATMILVHATNQDFGVAYLELYDWRDGPIKIQRFYQSGKMTLIIDSKPTTSSLLTLSDDGVLVHIDGCTLRTLKRSNTGMVNAVKCKRKRQFLYMLSPYSGLSQNLLMHNCSTRKGLKQLHIRTTNPIVDFNLRESSILAAHHVFNGFNIFGLSDGSYVKTVYGSVKPASSISSRGPWSVLFLDDQETAVIADTKTLLLYNSASNKWRTFSIKEELIMIEQLFKDSKRIVAVSQSSKLLVINVGSEIKIEAEKEMNAISPIRMKISSSMNGDICVLKRTTNRIAITPLDFFVFKQ